MLFSSEELTVVGTLGGALIGAIPQFVSSLIAKRADDKRHLRELVMKTAAENWRLIVENANSFYPFEHYMIHTALMCEIAFSDKPITEKRVREHIVLVDAVMQSLSYHAASVSKHASDT